jgi:dTDP-4-dehydrorhamnose reductase
MAVTEKYGVYHATNEGFCSWAEFAQEIFRQAGYTTKVEFIPSCEYPSKAVRPLNSRLSKRSLDMAGFRRLPPWQDAVVRYLEEIGERQNI